MFPRIAGRRHCGMAGSGGGWGERHFGRTGAVRQGFRIVSRWTAYVSNPPGVKKTGGWRSWKRSWKRFRINRQLRSPIFFRGHLTPLSRRSYQPENRFSSVSRPFLNVSGAASPLSKRARISPNCNDRPAQARTTVGLCGRGRRVARERMREVDDYRRDGGEGGSVTARAENNWPTDGHGWTRIAAEDCVSRLSAPQG